MRINIISISKIFLILNIFLYHLKDTNMSLQKRNRLSSLFPFWTMMYSQIGIGLEPYLFNEQHRRLKWNFFFSIALPFKKDTLQSMYSERSTFALVKYYIASVKCISAKSKEKTDLENFNQDFYDWLQQSVRCESLWSRVAIFLKYPIWENCLNAYKKSLLHKIL